MNGLIIEVADFQKNADTPTQPEQEEKSVESSLLQMMKRAYEDFFENRYEQSLPKNSKNEPIYPQFAVIIDEVVYEVVFDYEFYESLCDIYIIEGWSGVSVIANKIAEITVDESLSGGVKDKKWPTDVQPQKEGIWNLAKLFFNFTERILALLIRETLVNIEHLVAEQMVFELSLTNIEIQNTFDKYKIKSKTVKTKSDSLTKGHDVVVEETKTYWLENTVLSSGLFILLTVAVNEREKFNDTLKRLDVLQHRIENAESILTTDTFPNYDYQSDIEEQQNLTNLKQASEKFLETLQIFFLEEHPLGLLIYGSLEKGFEQPEMENLFCVTIDKLRLDLEGFGAKIDPQISQTEKLLPFVQTDDIYLDILRFALPPGGIEKFVLDSSLANYQKPEFLPLINEGVLNSLVDKEIIAADSFENVTAFHYLTALIKRLGEIELEQKKVEDFWKTIGKLSSALSLAALVTPVTAQFAPLLRGSAAIADLALLTYSVSSITENLRKFDEKLRNTLVYRTEFDNKIFAKLGEIISLRKEFYDNLTEQTAKEIFNILVGANIPLFKIFLLSRNYLYDLETLTEVDMDDAAEE